VCCNFSVEETVLCTVPQVVQNLQQAASRAKRLKSAGSAQEKPAVAPKPKKKGTTKRASRGSEHESVNAATVADAADVRRPAMAIVYPQPSMVFIHSVHTHTHPFNGPLSGTTRVSRYQKGETNLDFTEAGDSEWQWHQLGHTQVCISLQTDNHVSTPPLSFLQAGCPSCRPTNSVKALKAMVCIQ